MPWFEILRNATSAPRLLAAGCIRGSIPFERGTLFYLLRNRFYISEVRYKGQILPGEQPPIIYRALFDAIQQKLTDQRIQHDQHPDRRRPLLDWTAV